MRGDQSSLSTEPTLGSDSIVVHTTAHHQIQTHRVEKKQQLLLRSQEQVFLDNLPSGITWKQVKHICRDVGFNVKHVDIVPDANAGSTKAHAVVEFHSAEGASYAIEELNGIEINGRSVRASKDRGEPGRRKPYFATGHRGQG